MSAREEFRSIIFPTAVTRILVNCPTPLVTYITSLRSDATSNFFIFIMNCFAGDLNAR